jgi:phosphatidylserine synthase 1
LFLLHRDDSVSSHDNIVHGLIALVVIHMIVSVLAYPNGPFIRPHPAVWRIVFGISVLYLLFLNFILYQSYEVSRPILKSLGK